MIYQELLRLAKRAEVWSGGAELVILVGELVALDLVEELGFMPSSIEEYPLNPYIWGPGPQDIAILTGEIPPRFYAGPESLEVLYATMPTLLTPAQLETYTVLRKDGMTPRIAYEVCKALEP